MQKRPEPETRKNTLDTHAPDSPGIQQLSEKEKQQMEAGGEAERQQGTKREQVPHAPEHQAEE